MSELQKKIGISGYIIKIIAITTMVIDHLGYTLTWFFAMDGLIAKVYRICRMIGRISFPLFCFLLVEGFIHTKNRKNYSIRLLLFAFISEIPFDLAFDRMITFRNQNVFFTLTIGILVLYFIEKYTQNYMMQAIAFFGGCGISILLRTDYSWMGISMITIFYWFRKEKAKKIIMSGLIMLYSSFAVSYGAAIFACIPILLYNGKRGKERFKYIFYWFYPVHLLLLYIFVTIVR